MWGGINEKDLNNIVCLWNLTSFEMDMHPLRLLVRRTYYLPNAWLAIMAGFYFHSIFYADFFTSIPLVYWKRNWTISRHWFGLDGTGRSKLKSSIFVISCLNLLKYTVQNLDLRESESAWIVHCSTKVIRILNSSSPVTSSF